MEEKIDILRLNRAQLTTPAYKELIQSLFVKGDVDARLRYANWAFIENPALKPDEDLPIYLCRVDGKDAGQFAIIPVDIMFAGERIRGGWCVDFYVSPDYQRRGIGTKLLNSAFLDFPVLMTLGQTVPSFELFHHRLKWIYNDNRLTRYKSFLKKRLAGKYLLAKMGFGKGSPAPIAQSIHGDLPAGVSFESVDSFEGFPDFMRGKNLEDENVTCILRTVPFLTWRYLQHPFITYNLHKISVSSGQSILVVWREQVTDCWNESIIVDILYPGTVSKESMEIALDAFQKCIYFMGFETIECRTSDRLVLESFKDNFMSKREPVQKFIYGKKTMEDCPVIENDQWKLYAGDCDVDTLNF